LDYSPNKNTKDTSTGADANYKQLKFLF